MVMEETGAIIMAVVNSEYERAKTDPTARLRTVAPETHDILNELSKVEFTPMNKTAVKKSADVVNAVS